VRRFWPVKPLKKHSLDEGVRVAAGTLKGMIAAAYRRFPLAMSFSSGLDSRMIFSACRDFVEDVFVFSMMYRHLTPESDDIRVPREVTQAVELQHYLIDARVDMSPEFAELYQRNTTGIKDDWGKLVEGRYRNVPQGRVILKGTISEIIRCRYWPLGVYPYRVTLRDLVKLSLLGDDPLVVKSFKVWMQDALPTEKLGYKLLDIFSWENEVGNWLAVGHVVNDLSNQDFAPISNRRFITAMLGVDVKYRSYPDHIMERRITATLWPELDQFPYHPKPEKAQKAFFSGWSHPQRIEVGPIFAVRGKTWSIGRIVSYCNRGTGSFGKKFIRLMLDEVHPGQDHRLQPRRAQQHEMQAAGYNHPIAAILHRRRARLPAPAPGL